VRDSSHRIPSPTKVVVIDDKVGLSIAQLGDARPHGDPRLCGRNDHEGRSRGRWFDVRCNGRKRRSEPDAGADLIWCPNNGASARSPSSIAQRKNTLAAERTQNHQAVSEMVIMTGCVRAVNRGVRVRSWRARDTSSK